MLFEQCIGFLNTSPLWTKTQFGLTQFKFPEIDLKDFRPVPIPNRIRLGHQMEHVFKQFLSHDKRYDVVVHNLPIREGKQTIGEIDFILREFVTQTLVHVELTYKFYIINPDITEPIHQLMGPNRRDMFFTKMEKIKNEQIPLLHSKFGSLALQERDISVEDITHQVCYKAQLFRPYGMENVNIRPLNKNCMVGFWLRFESFKRAEFKSHTYYIPYKSEWVIAPHDQVEWTPHFETLLEINLRMIKENAPMVWMRKLDGNFEKFFVVWW